MRERHFTPMVAIAASLVLTTAWLIYFNAKSPGFCPPYPVLGTPACIAVEVYFVLILGSLFLPNRLGDAIFYVATGLALLSSLTISIQELQTPETCPRLFDIPFPLCFGVVISSVLLLTLKLHGQTRGEREVRAHP